MDFSIILWAFLGTLYGLFIGIIPSSGSYKALILLFSVASYFWGMPYEFVAFSMAAAVVSPDLFVHAIVEIKTFQILKFCPSGGE